ncbi:MAG: ribosome silencing factor [Leptolyngbyaceae bacterium]|nr:ribosome silencing factor [Leptolyngbyaceae bacterium]
MVDPSPTASVFSASVQLSESQPSQRQPQQGRSDSSHPISLGDNLALVTEMVKAADDRKATDITVLDVAEVSYLADYFVVVTGFSSAQVRAIARTVEDRVEETLQRTPYRVEGLRDGGWVLLDYGDCIIHIFLPKEREFYKLEAFWGHATPIDVASLLDP